MPERYLTLGFEPFRRRANRKDWIDRIYIYFRRCNHVSFDRTVFGQMKSLLLSCRAFADDFSKHGWFDATMWLIKPDTVAGSLAIHSLVPQRGRKCP